MNRTSKVDHIHVNSVGISSVFQIGDSNVIHSVSHAIAVQREKELFFGNENPFQSYDVFNRAFPFVPMDEFITVRSSSMDPMIKVGTIDILATSSAAVIHIGNSEHIQAEARTKHIRQMDSVENSNENEAKEE